MGKIADADSMIGIKPIGAMDVCSLSVRLASLKDGTIDTRPIGRPHSAVTKAELTYWQFCHPSLRYTLHVAADYLTSQAQTPPRAGWTLGCWPAS